MLQLGAAAESIAGRVVNPRGDPLAGIAVFLDQATLFSMTEGTRTVENLLGGDPGERITMFRTDEEGRFEIGGLLPRTYQLIALDLETGVQVRPPAIPAGSRGLEIVLDLQRTWKPVEGRVVSPSGEPLAGVDVNAFFDATNVTFQGESVRTSNFLLAGTSSDATGSFSLASVPREHAYLLVMGEGVVVTTFGLGEPLGDSDSDSLDDLELVVPRRAHVQVILDNPDEADEVGFLDAAGEPLLLRVHRGKPGAPSTRSPFYSGRTDVLSVAEHAHTLLHYKDGEIVKRRSVVLSTDELNEL